jgi:hypothetical protein
MKFDIAKVRRVMTEAAWMDLQDANNFVHQEAPEWRNTAVAADIVCGSTDPVRTAEEYNAIAGNRAVEYASGKVKL